MSASQLLRRGAAAIAATTLIAVGIVVSSPAPAHADPITVTDPASGAAITLSTNRISPGQRVEISGTGFTAKQGNTGEPLVAVRPYDYDDGPDWTVGGRDAYGPNPSNPTPHGEAKYWFVTHHDQDNGSFEGWIQAPSGLTKTGPLGNGSHWLRILSGAPFTTTGDRLTDPITFMVPFTVVDNVVEVSLGLTSPTSVFQEGTTFRPGAAVTVRGLGFTPNTAVAVTLDGNALASDITTNADGNFPDGARVSLPSDVGVGSHALRIGTGSVVQTVQITVTPAPTATVLTERVRPGGTLAFDLAGYIGVAGLPQKVAVVIDEKVLECIQTDTTGAARGAVKLPTSLSGSVVVGFNVGTSCQLPPSPINDQPISRSAPTITVSDTAPVLTAKAGTAGQLVLSGSGFTPNATVAIVAGSTNLGTLRANATGAIQGTVSAPTASGTQRILASDGTNAAAVKAAFAQLTLSAPSPLTYGSARTTTVGLKVAGQAAGGRVVVSQGTWSTTVSVPASGVLKVALPRNVVAGRHTVTAKIAATDSALGAEASRTFTVGKAASTAKLKVSPTKVKKSKRATATVRVTVNGAPQIAATGKITIYDKSKKLATGTLKAGHKGTVKVKLPKIKKKGTHKLKVTYAGNANISAKSSGIVKLKVV